MATLTAEQSKKGVQRSVEVRRANAIELPKLRQRVHELESQLAALAVKPTIDPKEQLPEILSRTREQLNKIDELLVDCSDAKEWDALTRSRERNFRILAHLAQLPGPGNLKPSTAKPRRTEPMPEPTPAIPQVVVAPVQAEPKPSQST